MAEQRIDNTRLDGLITDMRRQIDRMDQSRLNAEKRERALASMVVTSEKTLGSSPLPAPTARRRHARFS